MKGNVYIVDDDPVMGIRLESQLSDAGYHVEYSSSADEALEKIHQTRPDIIISDVVMPRMDGYQLCKIIRKNNETKHIPVIMLSGNDGFFDKVRGRMAGSTEYVTKPFKPKMLLELVKKHIC